VRHLRTARGYSQEGFAQEARLNRSYMGEVVQGLRIGGVVNLRRIAEAPGHEPVPGFSPPSS
jgi:transcriptional regulator with XRE-family HTH domain